MTITAYTYAETTPEHTRAGDALFKRIPDVGWLELEPADVSELSGAILALLQSNLIVLAVRELADGAAFYIRRS